MGFFMHKSMKKRMNTASFIYHEATLLTRLSSVPIQTPAGLFAKARWFIHAKGLNANKSTYFLVL
jgi:hypothetical protein